MNIILLGAPGSGKGTMAEQICKKYNLISISTGDIIRENVAKHTKLGQLFNDYISKGHLVPDELIIELVKDRLLKDDVNNGYILDGFPRTVAQADALKTFANINKVILLDTDYEVIKNRILSRLTCPSCKSVYNTNTYNKDFCEKCGTKLSKRSDDNEETVKERYNVYINQTSPLIDFYKNEGILKSVDGNKSIDEVFQDISLILQEG